MKALMVFAMLLLSSPCQAALNCMPVTAMVSVMTWNGFFEIGGGDSAYGDMHIFINPQSNHYKIWLVSKKQACEVLQGSEFYLLMGSDA